jgi:hypothetical protein
MISPAALGHHFSIAQHEQNRFDGLRSRAQDLRERASSLLDLERELKTSQHDLNNRELELNAREEALRKRERKISRREREAVATPTHDDVVPSASRSPWVAPPADNIDAVISAPIPPAGTAAHARWAQEQAQRVLDCWHKWNAPRADAPFAPGVPLVTEADHRAWAKAQQILEVGRKWATPDPEPDRVAVAREALALARSAPSTPSGSRQMRASDVIATGKKWLGDNSRFVS